MYDEPVGQESITETRRKHKKLHKQRYPQTSMENVSKTLEFDSPEKELRVEERICFNPFNFSIDQDIEAIEEASNETFTTINDDKELNKNDGSLFGLPQTTINKEGKVVVNNVVEHSF